jgi:hypothetical protein
MQKKQVDGKFTLIKIFKAEINIGYILNRVGVTSIFLTENYVFGKTVIF